MADLSFRRYVRELLSSSMRWPFLAMLLLAVMFVSMGVMSADVVNVGAGIAWTFTVGGILRHSFEGWRAERERQLKEHERAKDMYERMRQTRTVPIISGKWFGEIFTIEHGRTRYRELMLRYHPHLCQDEKDRAVRERIAQEINAEWARHRKAFGVDA